MSDPLVAHTVHRDPWTVSSRRTPLPPRHRYACRPCGSAVVVTLNAHGAAAVALWARQHGSTCEYRPIIDTPLPEPTP